MTATNFPNWQVDYWNGNRIAIQSAHGQNDEALILDGDFEDTAQKVALAQKICQILNDSGFDNALPPR